MSIYHESVDVDKVLRIIQEVERSELSIEEFTILTDNIAILMLNLHSESIEAATVLPNEEIEDFKKTQRKMVRAFVDAGLLKSKIYTDI